MTKLTLALAAAALTLAGCTSEAPTEATPQALRFTVIPDNGKYALTETCELLANWLGDEIGVPVTYLASNDYAGAVNNLIADKVDFVWLGGKTTCDAIDAGKGDVVLLAARDIDLDFKSYFIANKGLIEGGRLTALPDLKKLKEHVGELTFTFGSRDSTSGHLMPRYFLTEAGIDPDADFKGAPGFSGNHGATLAAVASGAVDLGALNFAVWDKASAEQKQSAPIVYTTPGYVDYAWCAHRRLGEATIGKLKAALLGLDRADETERQILDAWAAREKFVPADPKLWDSIRKVRDSLPKGFLK